MFKTLPTWVLILCYYKQTSNYSLVINGTVPYLLVCFKLLFWTTISTWFFLNNPYFITLLITCNFPYFWHFLPPSYCRCYLPMFPLLYIGLYKANLKLSIMYYKFFFRIKTFLDTRNSVFNNIWPMWYTMNLISTIRKNFRYTDGSDVL